MELVKIEIAKYKSIIAPVSVEFHKDLPTVLIGKNGSGKSNILEAIEHIAATNSNLPGKYGAGKLRYKAYIRLEKNEFARLFPNEEYSASKAVLAAYSSAKDGLHINTIESDTIVPLLKNEFNNVLELADKLKHAVEDYENILEKINCGCSDTLSICGYDIVNKNGNTTNFTTLKFQSRNFIDQVKSLRESMFGNFKSENTIVFSLPYYSVKTLFPPHPELVPFELRYKEPELAPFEQKFITIDKSAIEREIRKINKKTESVCNTVNEILSELKTQLERLVGIEEKGAIIDFVRDVTKIFGNNCGYLLSENSQVIFKDLRKENDYRYYDASRVIFESYAKKKGIAIDNNLVFTAEELKDFEKWLNTNRPKFDEGMYDKISVSINNNKISINIHENTGEIVSLNETSAGRRWYFTYFFVKNTLNKGDMFIIDEPASMLHPSAQKEILQDICDMSMNGIYVVYSTHSPYLIPVDWNCVGFVSMGTYGSEILPLDLNLKELGQFRSNSYLDIFGYHEAVDHFNKSEFKEKITKGIYSRLIEKYPTNSKAAKEIGVSERAFYNWQKAEKNIEFNNVLKAAFVLEIDVLTLIKECEK